MSGWGCSPDLSFAKTRPAMKSTSWGHAEISLFCRDEDAKPATVNIMISSKIFLPKAFQGNHEKTSEINMDEIFGTHEVNFAFILTA